MALNFPLNPEDGSIYIDNISGLKYIFNRDIGGWETAIQPPVIITSDGNAPDINIDGFLWYDTTTQILNILRGGTWTPVTGSGGGGGGSISVGPTPPSPAVQGDLWWDTVAGTMFIYYIDGSSNQWVIASPNVGGETNTNIYTDINAPDDPVPGTAWFNTVNDVLYIYDQGEWKAANSPVQGVASVTGIAPIVVTDNTTAPKVSINPGNEISKGSVRFANQSEVTSLADVDAALTPRKLAVGIDNYLPQATTEKKGAIEIATEQEVLNGADNTRAVTPATLQSAVNASGNPVGTIIAYAGSTAPTGYFICNGDVLQDVSVQTVQGVTGNFQNLISVIGYAYGDASGNIIRLPELRGEFLRGANLGRLDVDTGRAIGSKQDQSVQDHLHQYAKGNAKTAGADVGGGATRENVDGVGYTDISGAEGVGGDKNYKVGVTETRPRNVAIMYCIKF